MIVTFLFLLLFNEKRDSSFPSGLWIVLFWLPAETLSLKRLQETLTNKWREHLFFCLFPVLFPPPS